MIRFSKNCLVLLLPIVMVLVTDSNFVTTSAFLSTNRAVHPLVAQRNYHAKICNPNSNGLFAKKTSKSNERKAKEQQQRPKAQFEYQELRAQVTTIRNQKIRPKSLTDEKQNELESYMMKILLNCPSPIQLKSLGDDNAKALLGQWTLVFSTDTSTTGNNLPRDATIQLTIKENYKCDYVLQFAKTLGLKSITAKSNFIVDSSPVNPGLITMIYQEIVTDVLGFKNIPVGTFGLLKGRANYIESVWFDGLLWIERAYNEEGAEFFNIYLKSDDE